MPNINFLFVGGFFPDQLKQQVLLKSKEVVQNAANTFQWAFIKGMEQNLDRPVKLITAPFIGWYPKYYKDLIIKKSIFSNNAIPNSGVMVGFLNFPLIKSIFKYYNLLSSINNFIISNERNILIVYSIDLAYLKAAIKAKQKHPNTVVCVIITDLHDFPGDSGLIYKLYLNYIEKPEINKLLSKVDCFVVLVDKMIEYLKIQNRPWIRMEGIYDDKTDYQYKQVERDKINKIVLYTGSLDFRYGIGGLLDAFKLIKDANFRLWICGGGPGADMVINGMRDDDRIKYFGIVSKEKVAELQKNATILVNPRNTLGEYNKYSFPSKTIEYLASGTPCLIYKLDGIPAEYLDYFYTIEDNDVESLANAIYNTCHLDPDILKLRGERARDFILKNKNAKAQCARVLEMINKMGIK